MTVAEALSWSRQHLRQSEYGDGSESRILVAFVLGWRKEETLIREDHLLSVDQRKFLQKLVHRRGSGEPIARLLGEKEFWGLTFPLNEETLVPRPESELIVTLGLQKLEQNLERAHQPPQILDLGTGSGCLLLSLLHSMPHVRGIGIDVSHKAILRARETSHDFGLSSRAHFLQGSWFSSLSHETFDLIVSNPPYLSLKEMGEISKEVAAYDPERALVGGEKGTEPYEAITKQAPLFLKEGGWLIVEIGWRQGDVVTQLFLQAGFRHVSLHADLAGKDRCVIGQYL